MRVLSKPVLIEFGNKYPDAREPLSAWHHTCTHTDFENFASLKATFGSVDKVGEFTVFDIGGNKFRLIAVIHYNRRIIYIREVLTHSEYDRGNWKKRRKRE